MQERGGGQKRNTGNMCQFYRDAGVTTRHTERLANTTDRVKWESHSAAFCGTAKVQSWGAFITWEKKKNLEFDY